MAEKEYIERNALKNDGHSCWHDGKGNVYYEIDPAPAAEVAPVVHAEWEWFEEWRPSTPDAPWECEDCGWRCGKCKDALEDMVGGYWDNPEEKPKLNYCPGCGAKMDGGRKHD